MFKKKNGLQTPKIYKKKMQTLLCKPTWDFLVIFQCLVNLLDLTEI